MLEKNTRGEYTFNTWGVGVGVAGVGGGGGWREESVVVGQSS